MVNSPSGVRMRKGVLECTLLHGNFSKSKEVYTVDFQDKALIEELKKLAEAEDAAEADGSTLMVKSQQAAAAEAAANA